MYFFTTHDHLNIHISSYAKECVITEIKSQEIFWDDHSPMLHATARIKIIVFKGLPITFKASNFVHFHHRYLFII